MVTCLFLFITITIVVWQKKREGRWVNLLSLLMGPYIIIVFLNNFFIYKLGFFKISDDVLLMLTSAFCVFFIGTLPFKFTIYKFTDNKNKELLRTYNISKMKIFLYIVGFLGIFKVLYLFRQGLIFSADSVDENEMSNGLTAHLLLASLSILPIYFLYWSYNRNIRNFIPILLVIIVASSSMVKYNVIGPIISIFIIICLYRKSLLKKATIFLTSFIVTFFVANYALGFAIAGVDVAPSFYLGHFWTYFAGSLIDDNYIFTKGINVGVSIFEKLMIFFFTLPNMFINKFTGTKYYPFTMLKWESNSTGDIGESSNVVDVIGFLFPSHGDGSEILFFYIIILLTGFVFSYLYIKCCNQKNKINTFIVIFLTYFVFLDFYSPFFVLVGPWEILIWCLILPKLFKNKSTYNEFNRIQCI